MTRLDSSQLANLALELRKAVSGSLPLPALTVVYDDMHELWGGVAIRVGIDRIAERRERGQGESEASILSARVSDENLRKLIEMLVELAAWEQQTAEAQPIPDESRAFLLIEVGRQKNRIWERFNEMPANDRLIRIKNYLESLFDG